jgi:hypothetical protein
MKCTEIKRILKNEYIKNKQVDSANATNATSTTDATYDRAMAHAKLCEDCGAELAMERLTLALLKAYASSEKEVSEPPYLMGRIRARIRELGEQGVGSWESAILALRGWIFAFGAVALLLLTMSVQWKFSNPPGIDPVDDATSLINISEEFISSVR